MFEIAETAKNMIVKLNEIQPAMRIAGMDGEAEKIKEMKGDLAMMIASISPDHPCMARVLVALREDVMSSSIALFELLEQVPDDMTDGQLDVILLAAESLVKRGRDYLDSKRKAFELTGGKYGRA